MGFRFRRSIKLFPGVTINLSKSGVSASLGVPGATVNVGKRGTRSTVGVPGTGLSYSDKLSGPPERTTPAEGMGFGKLLAWGLVALFVFLVVYGLMTG